MKKTLLFLVSLFISLLVPAQTLTQKGFVRTAGRPGNIKGTRLAGAVIAVAGSNSVQSQKDGAFSLAFSNAKAGSTSFRINSVKLGGYSVLDPAMLTSPHPIAPLIPFEIVLVSEKEKAAIRENVERSVKARYDAELARVKREKDQLGARYQAELDRVNEKYKNCDSYVADAVERYSHLDYATLSYAQASFYTAMEQGDLEAADAVLRQTNASKLQEDRSAILANMAKEQQALEGIDAQLTQYYEGRFELFAARFEGDSAMHYADLLVGLDTTNVANLRKAGDYANYNLSDFSRALSYYTRASRQAEKQYGLYNGETAKSLKDLAFLFYKMRRTDEARATMLKAYEITLRCYGGASLLTAQSCTNMASCYDDIQDSTTRKSWNDKALAIVENHSAITEPDSLTTVATLYNNVGIYHKLHNQLAKADRYYQLAVDAYTRAGEKPSSTIYANLAVLRYDQGKTDDVVRYYNLAIERLKSEPLHSAQWEGTLYLELADKYHSMKDEANAEKYFSMAHDVLVRQYGETGVPMTNYYTWRSSHLVHHGKYKEAIPLYEKCLEIEKRAYGDKADTLSLYRNIAVCHFQSFQYAEAVRWYKKALHASESANGANDVNTIAYINTIVNCYMSLGAYDEALEWDKEAEKRTEAIKYQFNFFNRYIIMAKTNTGDWEKNSKKFMADKNFLIGSEGSYEVTLMQYGAWDRSVKFRSLIDYIEKNGNQLVGATFLIGKKYYQPKIAISPYDYSVRMENYDGEFEIGLFKVGKLATKATKFISKML